MIESLWRRVAGWARSNRATPTDVPDPELVRLWRQGDVLSPSLTPYLGTQLRPGYNAVLIVVSADCDVSASDFEKEPFVEVLEACPAEERDGNLTHGKNPRELQFVISCGEDHQTFYARIDDRSRIPREILGMAGPDRDRLISPAGLIVLRRWVSKRYSRAAFPDAFNSRIRPQLPEIRKTLKVGGSDLNSIWIGLSTREELEAGAIYGVQMVGVMLAEDFEDAARREETQRCFDDFLAIIYQCDDVEVEKEALMADDDFSLRDARMLDRWDWDDITLRNRDETEPPLDGDA